MMTFEHEEELLRHLAFMVSYQAKLVKLMESIDGRLQGIDSSLEAMYSRQVTQ